MSLLEEERSVPAYRHLQLQKDVRLSYEAAVSEPFPIRMYDLLSSGTVKKQESVVYISGI